MIFDKIENISKHSGISSKQFTYVVDLLEQKPYANVVDGRYEVNGSDLFYNVETYVTKPLEGGLFEAHRSYIDIQLITLGSELVGCTKLDGLKVAQEYCPERDVAFYHPNGDMDSIILLPGSFCMLFPEDAHMPCRIADAPKTVRKVVIKVRIDF